MFLFTVEPHDGVLRGEAYFLFINKEPGVPGRSECRWQWLYFENLILSPEKALLGTRTSLVISDKNPSMAILVYNDT